MSKFCIFLPVDHIPGERAPKKLKQFFSLESLELATPHQFKYYPNKISNSKKFPSFVESNTCADCKFVGHAEQKLIDKFLARVALTKTSLWSPRSQQYFQFLLISKIVIEATLLLGLQCFTKPNYLHSWDIWIQKYHHRWRLHRNALKSYKCMERIGLDPTQKAKEGGISHWIFGTNLITERQQYFNTFAWKMRGGEQNLHEFFREDLLMP